MPSFKPTETLHGPNQVFYISHVCTTFASVLYAACQLLTLFHPHYAYILVNLLYMHTHTHTIIYALPGFSMMFPHFSIYSCVRGLSFSYLLSNILSTIFLWLGEGDSYKKTSSFRTSCCDMLTSALSALLPRTRDRSDANLWKRTVLRSVQFGASWLSIFATSSRTMNRHQAWWGHESSILRFASFVQA